MREFFKKGGLMKKYFAGFFAVVFATMFVACDFLYSVKTVKSVDDLPNCTEARDGRTFIVSDKNAYYICVAGVWTKAADRKTTNEPANEPVESSSSEEISSSSIVYSSSEEVSSSSEESSSSSLIGGYDPVANTLMDLRDNKTYKTVTIGSQIWLAENLNFEYNVRTEDQEAVCFCYRNSVDSCAKYGRLYTWSAAMDSAAVFSTTGKGCGVEGSCNAAKIVRGICPEGWHLPAKAEWDSLFAKVGGAKVAGASLKSTSGWSNNGNGSDTLGFAVLPAGFFNNEEEYFTSAGRRAAFWTSTEYESYESFSVNFYNNRADVSAYNSDKGLGFSIRCVKDAE